MSECVVRMEIPESCLSCPFFNKVGCKASNRMFPGWMNVATRPKDCPIICQLPEGHGRMVDADAFIKHLYTEWANGEISNSEWCDIRQRMDEAPTIVPAEAERSEHERTDKA